MYKLVILCLVFMVGCTVATHNLDDKLELGMTLKQSVETMGGPPQKVRTSSHHIAYEYHYYSNFWGWMPMVGTRILIFDMAGVLNHWYGFGYINGRVKK
jgi:hypothetical protein